MTNDLDFGAKKKNVLGTSWFNFFNFFNSPAMILSGWMQTFWLGVYVEANPGGLVYVAEPQPPTLHFHFSFGALPQTVGLKSIFTISDGWKNSVKMPVQAGTGKKEKKKKISASIHDLSLLPCCFIKYFPPAHRCGGDEISLRSEAHQFPLLSSVRGGGPRFFFTDGRLWSTSLFSAMIHPTKAAHQHHYHPIRPLHTQKNAAAFQGQASGCWGRKTT